MIRRSFIILMLIYMFSISLKLYSCDNMCFDCEEFCTEVSRINGILSIEAKETQWNEFKCILDNITNITEAGNCTNQTDGRYFDGSEVNEIYQSALNECYGDRIHEINNSVERHIENEFYIIRTLLFGFENNIDEELYSFSYNRLRRMLKEVYLKRFPNCGCNVSYSELMFGVTTSDFLDY